MFVSMMDLCTIHLYIQVPSLYNTSLYKSHLCTIHLNIQVPSLYNTPQHTSPNSVQYTSTYKSHLCTIHLNVQVPSLYNTPQHTSLNLYNIPQYTSPISVQYTSTYKSHLCTVYLNIQDPLTSEISIPILCTLNEYNVNVIFFLHFIHCRVINATRRLVIRLCFRRPVQKGSNREVHFLLLKKKTGLSSQRLRLKCKSTMDKLRTKEIRFGT
jgi:hypothetical protein